MDLDGILRVQLVELILETFLTLEKSLTLDDDCRFGSATVARAGGSTWDPNTGALLR